MKEIFRPTSVCGYFQKTDFRPAVRVSIMNELTASISGQCARRKTCTHGTPRGIFETWRTLEPRQILRAPDPFIAHCPECQPANKR